MKCERCEIDYPNHLVRPLIMGRLGQSLQSVDVCGICALEIVNELHGLNDSQFHAHGAETVRRACVKWRQDNNLVKVN